MPLYPSFSRPLFFRSFIALLVAVLATLSVATLAQDVVRPARVSGLLADHDGADLQLTWDPAALDAAGQPETVDHYNVYRGETGDFVPDKAGGSNLVGSSLVESFTDVGVVAATGVDYYYLITAIDAAGNESDSKTPLALTPPVLSGFWTDTTIEVDWTPAEPSDDVVAYRVYAGQASGQYTQVEDVGLATSHSLTGLQTLVNWYIAVTAVDVNGNESAFSNEHIDPVAGRVRVRAHDAEEICWGASNCTPADPAKLQRNNGFQILVPVVFPEGEWTKVTVNYTMDSRLCRPGQQGTITKCGNNPDQGGWNPCGDPWDRLAHLFLVLDDCVDGGGNCRTNTNLELMRAITPFGTDAAPPDGFGVVPPRRLQIDITPYARLMSGPMYVGAEIVHYTQKGWWVTSDFIFTKRPEDASPIPPADGVEIVGYQNAPLVTKSVSVPAAATDVKMRLFTSGHGGSLYCDGGSNDANPCSSSAECPGGVCNPCDEFCHRDNRIIVDGTPVWVDEPWRNDCNPGGGTACRTWNACGYPSCTYPRAGWCPGYIACHENAPCDNDLDATGWIPAGGTYDIDYDIVPRNGSWPVSLVIYWYE